MSELTKPRLFYDRGDTLELIAATPDDLDTPAGLVQHLRDLMECGGEDVEVRIVLKFKTDAEVEALPEL